MKRITLDLLKSLDACSDQHELFAETFPEGMALEDFDRAVEAGIDVCDLAMELDFPAYESMERAAQQVRNEAAAPLVAEFDSCMAQYKGLSWAERLAHINSEALKQKYAMFDAQGVVYRKTLLEGVRAILTRYLTS